MSLCKSDLVYFRVTSLGNDGIGHEPGTADPALEEHTDFLETFFADHDANDGLELAPLRSPIPAPAEPERSLPTSARPSIAAADPELRFVLVAADDALDFTEANLDLAIRWGEGPFGRSLGVPNVACSSATNDETISKP